MGATTIGQTSDQEVRMARDDRQKIQMAGRKKTAAPIRCSFTLESKKVLVCSRSTDTTVHTTTAGPRFLPSFTYYLIALANRTMESVEVEKRRHRKEGRTAFHSKMQSTYLGSFCLPPFSIKYFFFHSFPRLNFFPQEVA